MSKVYLLTDADFERLTTLLDRDPKHGYDGGSSKSHVRDDLRERALDEAHRFYNYQAHKWIDDVKK